MRKTLVITVSCIMAAMVAVGSVVLVAYAYMITRNGHPIIPGPTIATMISEWFGY